MQIAVVATAADLPPKLHACPFQPAARRRIGREPETIDAPSTCGGDARGWVRPRYHGHRPRQCYPRRSTESGTYASRHGPRGGTLRCICRWWRNTGTDIIPDRRASSEHVSAGD